MEEFPHLFKSAEVEEKKERQVEELIDSVEEEEDSKLIPMWQRGFLGL